MGLALVVMAARANAGVIYNTNAPGTGFGGTNLSLQSASGVMATLTYIPNGDTDTGVPSNINFGNFTLLCSACSTQALNAGAFFDPFFFNLVITDVTDGGTGQFTGFSTGGAVFSDVSQITLNWAPLQLGPDANNASSGSFGPTTFEITSMTRIVAPNSGQVPGQTTVQGSILGSDGFPIIDEVPEPATMALVAFSLIGLGAYRRRRNSL